LHLAQRLEGFPWDDLRKIFSGCQRMAAVPNDVETLPETSTSWVACTNVTDDRQTDGRQTDGRQHIANVNSLAKRKFTFAKNLRPYTPLRRIIDTATLQRGSFKELRRSVHPFLHGSPFYPPPNPALYNAFQSVRHPQKSDIYQVLCLQVQVQVPKPQVQVAYKYLVFTASTVHIKYAIADIRKVIEPLCTTLILKK